MLSFDPMENRYASRRSVVYGRKGMTAASQPLAAQAGLEAIISGGNAVDAAITTAACLTVMEPTGCGIGGDAFALIWSGGRLRGLNASGCAPEKADAAELRKNGHEKMPKNGWYPVNVPGIPAAWAEMSARFGKLPFARLLEPAINYAERGFPVSPIIALQWKRQFDNFSRELDGEQYKYLFETFTVNGRAPRAGEMWRNPAQARSLREIAETKAESFYLGQLAEKIDAFSRKYGGWLRYGDLAAYKPEWVQPISTDYRGFDIWEIPPNGQGIAALMALNILKNFDLPERETAESYHLQIEAMKLAFADAMAYVADPGYMEYTVSQLLSAEFAAERARRLDPKKAALPSAGKPFPGGTVYLAAADGDGNMVSFIQSNYNGFGSGLAVPDTGITLHNRGNNFSLDPRSANCLAPGKKPYHTIIPGFITKDGAPVGPFGVMGAFMQPQGHVQMALNLARYQMNPQDALNAPRWQWLEGMKTGVEGVAGQAIIEGLKSLGHDIEVPLDSISYGRGQIILRDENSVLAGATEPRADGHIAVY